MIGYSSDQEMTASFEAIVLPHLDAAYNLARWLAHDDHTADDIVQMAVMRAFRFFDGYRGGDARAWLLTIVRNTYFTVLRDTQYQQEESVFDEECYDRDGTDQNPSIYNIATDPEKLGCSDFFMGK